MALGIVGVVEAEDGDATPKSTSISCLGRGRISCMVRGHTETLDPLGVVVLELLGILSNVENTLAAVDITRIWEIYFH